MENIEYTVTPLRIEDKGQVLRFVCKEANIDEEILAVDLKGLIEDLPNIINKLK